MLTQEYVESLGFVVFDTIEGNDMGQMCYSIPQYKNEKVKIVGGYFKYIIRDITTDEILWEGWWKSNEAFLQTMNELKILPTKYLEDFKQYERTQIAEMRPVTAVDIGMINNKEYVSEYWSSRVSISQVDREKGSPKFGDMIARNPNNHDDQWLVEEQYFKDNFKLK